MIRVASVLMLSAAIGAASAPAARADSRLTPAFSNTIVSTYPDGRQAKLWLEPGGVYKATGRRGKASSGRWTVQGDQICLRQSRPIPIPKSYCTGIVKGGVGSEWSGKAVTGEPIKLELVPGRSAGTSQTN